MIDRLSEVVTGVLELVRAETDLAIFRARGALLQLAVVAAGLAVALLSITAMLVALTWALAEQIGWAGSLAIVGAGGLVIAAIIIALAAPSSKRLGEQREAKRAAMQRANAATRQIEGEGQLETAPDAGSESAGAPSPPAPESAEPTLKDKLLEAVLDNPAAVAGGALTIISLLGPMRTLRLIGRTTMVAGLASSALDKLKDADAPTR